MPHFLATALRSPRSLRSVAATAATTATAARRRLPQAACARGFATANLDGAPRVVPNGLGTSSPWATDPWLNVEDTVAGGNASEDGMPSKEALELERGNLAIPMSSAEAEGLPTESAVSCAISCEQRCCPSAFCPHARAHDARVLCEGRLRAEEACGVEATSHPPLSLLSPLSDPR